VIDLRKRNKGESTRGFVLNQKITSRHLRRRSRQGKGSKNFFMFGRKQGAPAAESTRERERKQDGPRPYEGATGCKGGHVDAAKPVVKESNIPRRHPGTGEGEPGSALGSLQGSKRGGNLCQQQGRADLHCPAEGGRWMMIDPSDNERDKNTVRHQGPSESFRCSKWLLGEPTGGHIYCHVETPQN